MVMLALSRVLASRPMAAQTGPSPAVPLNWINGKKNGRVDLTRTKIKYKNSSSVLCWLMV